MTGTIPTHIEGEEYIRLWNDLNTRAENGVVVVTNEDEKDKVLELETLGGVQVEDHGVDGFYVTLIYEPEEEEIDADIQAVSKPTKFAKEQQ